MCRECEQGPGNVSRECKQGLGNVSRDWQGVHRTGNVSRDGGMCAENRECEQGSGIVSRDCVQGSGNVSRKRLQGRNASRRSGIPCHSCPCWRCGTPNPTECSSLSSQPREEAPGGAGLSCRRECSPLECLHPLAGPSAGVFPESHGIAGLGKNLQDPQIQPHPSPTMVTTDPLPQGPSTGF